jgi:hypothetical protein
VLLLGHIVGVVFRLGLATLVGAPGARTHAHQMGVAILGLQLLHHHL